jgi:ABC-type glycerol-3-phosphate transport system substrate-binding protein
MPKGARYAEMEGAFARGQVAMMINGPWAWDNVRKVGIDFGVAPMPGIGGKPSKPFVGVLGCMITAPSKHQGRRARVHRAPPADGGEPEDHLAPTCRWARRPTRPTTPS